MSFSWSCVSFLCVGEDLREVCCLVQRFFGGVRCEESLCFSFVIVKVPGFECFSTRPGLCGYFVLFVEDQFCRLRKFSFFVEF